MSDPRVCKIARRRADFVAKERVLFARRLLLHAEQPVETFLRYDWNRRSRRRDVTVFVTVIHRQTAISHRTVPVLLAAAGDAFRFFLLLPKFSASKLRWVSVMSTTIFLHDFVTKNCMNIAAVESTPVPDHLNISVFHRC